MRRQLPVTVTALRRVAPSPSAAERPGAAAPRARLFDLIRQHDRQDANDFVEERVVSPHFARAFQAQAAASFRHPPAL
ncbi:hypothetical protein M4578_04790 [Salipiger sp. P9]|uniref:hypothetical protein n=1 Tax=Salipiger pentaromativorans TaxID=2943193 RepID=UPI0021585A87|nr:hypothetical protein [Salipiger pentaromativorans]MCR8547132.1 hypothetical protein [Salipiger pentaromativorans]